MSALREEIRTILREELLSLRSEVRQPTVEPVQITSDSDLNRFARELLARARAPDFVERVTGGMLSFALATSPKSLNTVMPVPRQAGADIDKGLITERDIASLSANAHALRLRKHARLTPLARDEAQRRGIRIERTE